jgi:hypothetical protein
MDANQPSLTARPSRRMCGPADIVSTERLSGLRVRHRLEADGYGPSKPAKRACPAALAVRFQRMADI